MPTRSIKVWNATAAVWEDVAVAQPDTSALLASTNPAALGTAAPGSGTTAARADHVHPTTGLVTPTGTATLSNKSFSGSIGGDPTFVGNVQFTGTPGFYGSGTIVVAQPLQIAGDATFQGSVLIPDGSAASPGIANTGDTNTGILFPDADTLAISTGGVERLRVTSAGRVLLPAGSILEAPMSLNAQTGNYTLVIGDAGRMVEMGSASAITLTVPADASVAFPVGTKIDVLRTGAGEVSIAGATSPNTVTVNSEGAKLRINAQWQAVTLIKRAANTWVLIGAIKA